MRGLEREIRGLEQRTDRALDRRDAASALDLLEALGFLLCDRFHADSYLPRFEALAARLARQLAALRVDAAGERAPSRERRVFHLLSAVDDHTGHSNACWNVVRGLAPYRRQAIVVPDRSERRRPNRRLEELRRDHPDVAFVGAGRGGRVKALLHMADRLEREAEVVVWHANPIDVDLWMLVRLVSVPTVYVHHPPPSLVLAFGRWDCDAHLDFRRSNAERCGRRAPAGWSGSVAEVENSVRDFGATTRRPRPLAGAYAVSVAPAYKLLDGPASSDFLERAVADLLAANPRLQYVLVGPTLPGLDAARHALAPDIRHRIHFTGPQDDVASWLQHARCYLNTFPMGTGLSLLEALSVGLPVVSLAPSDRAPAYSEALSPEQLVPDVAAYVARASQFVRGEPIHERVSRENRRRYAERYAIDAVGRRYHRFLDTLPDAPPPPTDAKPAAEPPPPRWVLRYDRPAYRPGLQTSVGLLRSLRRRPFCAACWRDLRHLSLSGLRGAVARRFGSFAGLGGGR